VLLGISNKLKILPHTAEGKNTIARYARFVRDSIILPSPMRAWPFIQMEELDSLSFVSYPLCCSQIKSKFIYGGVAMKLARDIMSLSTFKRDSSKVMRQMKKTKEPIVLTVNGKAAVVVQDAEGYQSLLDLKERSEIIAVLRQRLSSLDSKKGRTADEFFTEFFARNNIPTED
jgi:prevent-host-death family protein